MKIGDLVCHVLQTERAMGFSGMEEAALCYDAVDDYNQWLKDKEEADAIAADLAYERHLEELLNK